MKKIICSLLALLTLTFCGGINIIAAPAIGTAISQFVISDSDDVSNVLDALEGRKLTCIEYTYSEEYDKILLKVTDEENNAEFELIFKSLKPGLTLTSSDELHYITTKYVTDDKGQITRTFLIFMTGNGEVIHIPTLPCF